MATVMHKLYQMSVLEGEQPAIPADAIKTSYKSYLWTEGKKSFMGEMFGTGEWYVWEFITPEYLYVAQGIEAPPRGAVSYLAREVIIWKSQAHWLQFSPRLVRCIRPIGS